MDPEATLAALREFCAERLGAELATRLVDRRQAIPAPDIW
jgi:hypothetical protein